MPRKINFFIHPGYGKTGTTFLQESVFNKINFGSLPYLVVFWVMDRRNFLKNTCSVACACAFVGVSTLLQSCEDNIDDDYNTNTGGGTTGDGDQDDDYQLVVDIQNLKPALRKKDIVLRIKFNRWLRIVISKILILDN